MDKNQTPEIPLTNVSQIKRRMTLSFLTALVVFAYFFLQINPLDIAAAFPEIIAFFKENFFPPNFRQFASYVPLILETLFFAVVATCLSAVISVFFGLLMAEAINPVMPVRLAVRLIVSLIRNIPVLVWASLLVYIFGIGSLVGILALILATFGFLTRSYAEEMNAIAGSKLEALRAVGASRTQLIVHGLIPEFFPAWINWTLFSFEINIRASAILGMVGAGGVGILIQTNIRLFKYREAMSLIITLVILVLLTELCVNKVRKIIL